MSKPFDSSEAGVATRPATRASGETQGLCLLVLDPRGVVRHPLPLRGAVVLGRLDACDIVLADPSISRRHAEITVGPRPSVRDLGSANGVFVRGVRLAPETPVEIAVGEVFEVGDAMLVLQPDTAAARSELPSVASTLGTGSLATAVEPAGIVVRAPAMRKVFELVARVAASNLGVLLSGETGVGKEIVTEALHRASPRAAKPLLRLNCAALSESLLESELFGHEKGAFTGAASAKAGLLESADGGTVFLDEVGELPARLQAKLLRVLEEQSVLRVGGLRARPIDVRFVAATNRDLRAEVEQGAFRRDLYFRLNGITIAIPPLRSRREEIEELAQFFLARAASSPPRLSRAALALMQGYPWPGNIRELRNAIERAVLLADGGEILPAHLPAEITGEGLVGDAGPAPSLRPSLPAAAAGPSTDASAGASATGPGFRAQVEQFERARVMDALEKCGGNQTRAAELLGISRRALVARLASYRVAARQPKRGR